VETVGIAKAKAAQQVMVETAEDPITVKVVTEAEEAIAEEKIVNREKVVKVDTVPLEEALTA
jgi:hypothetical protein